MLTRFIITSHNEIHEYLIIFTTKSVHSDNQVWIKEVRIIEVPLHIVSTAGIYIDQDIKLQWNLNYLNSFMELVFG